MRNIGRREGNTEAIIKRVSHFSFTKRRVALLGNTERSIRTCRRKNTSRLQPKKAIPAAIKTLGDYLLVKRYEKGLQQRYVAQMAGVATLTVAGRIPLKLSTARVKPHTKEESVLTGIYLRSAREVADRWAAYYPRYVHRKCRWMASLTEGTTAVEHAGVYGRPEREQNGMARRMSFLMSDLQKIQ